MLRQTWCLCRYLSIDQVAKIVKAKQSGSYAVRDIQLIDVRSTAEVAATGMIPSAINVPLPVLRDVLSPDSILEDAEFEFFFGGPRPVQGVTQIVLYCAHGVRSAIACEIVEELGFDNAGNFSGSWSQWYHAYGTPSTSAAVPESLHTPLK
ncbi:conserved hypothetical protein [Leishmania mexicana MHOM/GT/2001/U1103]|uniref:Rhodanese domain-containing protein n=1 Tax=Leishmania mexicana (strain MHOM/GT/2001/U1103) TaxID=929439 RepID=E9AMZ8_LEIMU|nr:conserved hypothetical protein [Leishmania mexicana MHOM/GT/2001/U1103]CBZ24303.1 conserved hypothetical protein [Leishmania mexicana MHOM/GT/2001/U1103]